MQKSITMTEKLKIEAVNQGENTFITIKSPNQLDGISRTPTDICCVIDISGSMGSEAKIHTDAGKTEGYGYTTLDLVKHSLATIINALGSEDRLALVSFNSQAQVVLNLTAMNDQGKKRALKACKELDTDGSTNLWGGLKSGLDILKNSKARKNSAIMLLTDGQPNIEPPRGHSPSLLKYQAENGLPSHMHLFGFGYEMNSKLLNELAIIGNGAYSYIPDGSFVGTVFINSLANILTSVAGNLKLKISLENCKISDKAPMLTMFNHKFASNELIIDIGNVGFGQDRSIVLPIELGNSKELKIEVTYETMFNDDTVRISEDVFVQESQDVANLRHFARLQTVLGIEEALNLANSGKLTDGYKRIENLMSQLGELQPQGGDKYLNDLLYDLKEQVLLALSKQEYWTKWGSHYFYSLARAHIIQQRNNFKDPGVQHYGGEVFEGLRDKIEEIFLTIPPPEPTGMKDMYIGGGNVSQSNSHSKYSSSKNNPPVQMSAFYNVSGGCISGDSDILMADGTIKLIRDIKKDDLVAGPEGQAAKVICVMKTVVPEKRAIMCTLPGGLKITPWHPVRLEGKWNFPEDISAGVEIEMEEYFDFVLDQGHSVRVNGIECVTLGHGFDEEVVRHEYFGSDAVVKDLAQLPGFEEGLVEITPDFIKRDEKTLRITGIKALDYDRRIPHKIQNLMSEEISLIKNL